MKVEECRDLNIGVSGLRTPASETQKDLMAAFSISCLHK